MHRAIHTGPNKVCAARVRKRYEDQRAQRLRDMRPQIDTISPQTMGMAHLKHNKKREEMQNQRHDLIERDNRTMLNKMHEFAKKPEYSAHRSNSLPALRNCPGGPAQQREYDRIMQANGKMLGRLRNMQSEMNVRGMESSYENSKKYMHLKCEYPPLLRRKGSRMLPPRSGLTRLPDGAPDAAYYGGSAVAGHVGSRTDEGLSEAMDSGGELRYVLREDRPIDGALYSVEMATDGCALAVSIYDAEEDHGLELLVSEENHHALYHECRGDYGMVAARLRIEGDQLFVVPLDQFNLTQQQQQQAGEAPLAWAGSGGAISTEDDLAAAAAAAPDLPPMPQFAGGLEAPQENLMGPPAGTVTFQPSTEWQEVPPGAVCPAGLEYHMDMQTGKNYARLC